MNWKIAMTVALLTAILTAVAAIPVSIKAMAWRKVSDMEGAQGYAVGFIAIPAGLIAGFLLGLLGTKLVHAMEWAHFWKALGLSAVLGLAANVVVGGFVALGGGGGGPRTPSLKGPSLALEFEVRLPEARLVPDDLHPDGIRLSLYAGQDDNHYARIDTARYRHEDGQLVVTALAGLNTRSNMRMIFFYVGAHTQLQLMPLPLAAEPGEADRQWTAFVPMEEAKHGGGTSTVNEARVRYRVVDGP